MKRFAFTLGMLLVLTGCTSTLCPTNSQALPDSVGKHFNLQQCWDKSDQIRFYTTNQGSQIVPYELIKHLEVPQATDKFFSRANFERWRFLPLEQTDRDQHSDIDKEVQDWPLGFVITNTTSGKQAWRGKWLGVNCAGCHTGQVEYNQKKIRIDGAPTMANLNQFLWDLQAALKATYEDGLKNGDKFKRYAKNFPEEREKALLERLEQVVTEHDLWHDRNDPPTAPGFARLDAVGIIFNQLIYMSGGQPVDGFKSDAPVSFPFLWDTSHHNQTQWNGVSPALPMVRNVVQGIGAFAKYDPDAGWFEDPSTIPLSNQRALQALVYKLRSPEWPQDILGPIDQKKAALGEKVFEQKCGRCHETQERKDPLKKIKMAMTEVKELKTDPKMADNAEDRKLLDRDGSTEYIHLAAKPVSLDILFSSHHIGESFPFVGEVISAFWDWGSNFGKDQFGKRYKGRPLDGIWATAPYLHNGSVPNLYQLLVSAERKPFYIGSRQFDPKHVGFDPEDKSGTLLDPSIPGNSNTGHDSTTYGGALDLDTEVWPLIEYMKTL
jgi:hypothetical protein